MNVRIMIPFSSSVQFSHSVVSDSLTPWTAARQASLSITNSQSLLQLLSIESMVPSSHLILCRPLLLLPSIFPSIRVFSNDSILSSCIRAQFLGETIIPSHTGELSNLSWYLLSPPLDNSFKNEMNKVMNGVL